MGIYLSNGNSKIIGSENIKFLVFALPRKLTCPLRTGLCEHYCYAAKAERQYIATRAVRKMNLQASRKKTFELDMIGAINAQLEKFRKQGQQIKIYFRIHESGDFYNPTYFRKWLTIIKTFPEITFLAFTKSGKIINKWLFSLPVNLRLYQSIWPDTDEGDIIQGLPKAYTYMGLQPIEGVKKCSGECGNCLHCFDGVNDVQFALH
jgi:hypothetical protein